MPKPKSRHVPYTFVDSEKSARKALKVLKKHKVCAVDTEFPITGPRRHEIVIWSVSAGADTTYVIAGHLLKTMFADWLEDPKYKKVWWNYKEDGDVVRDFSGLDLDHSFHADGMIMDWSVDETDIYHNLKHSGEKHLNWKRKGYAALFCYVPSGLKKPVVVDPTVLMEGPLPQEMLEVRSHKKWIKLFKQYAADDAAQTILLFKKLKKILKRRGYWDEYLRVDAPYTVTLRKCQSRGVHIDLEELRRIYRNVSREMVRLRYTFGQQTGVDDSFNIQSNQQKHKLFFDILEWPNSNTSKKFADLVTKSGAPQLDAKALARYANEYGFESAATLAKYNKLKTKKGTFLGGMLDGVRFGRGAEEGVLYSDFNQIGAESGRISSRKYPVIVEELKLYKTRPPKLVYTQKDAGMNLQNIPNAFNDDLGIRKVFIPPPGYVMLVADFSAFELWLMLWNCHRFGIKSKMLKALMAGKDVHAMTTVVVCELDCHWSEVKTKHPGLRNRMGKPCNFNLTYGGRAKMLASIVGWDIRDKKAVDKAQGMIDAWHRLWPEMALVQQALVDYAYDHGHVTTIGGRRRHLKDMLDWQSFAEDAETRRQEEWKRRNHAENVAKNVTCQGSAADIMKEAMNLIERDEKLKRWGYQQLFPVHDEIVGVAPRETAEKCLRRKIKLMQKPQSHNLPFDLLVEGGIAENWLEAK